MRSILPLLLFFNCFIGLYAAPVLDHVSHGSAKFHQQQHQLTIEAADHSIINYKSFDIHAHESVCFQMKDPSHRVFNRIHSSHPSQINGTLTANGILYLVNPVGIIFGPNSVVNVTQLYAAAAHLSDQDFLLKKDLFSKIQGAIEIHGLIEADHIALIGKSVTQNGTIKAKHVLYAVGEQLLFGKEGEHVFIRVKEESLAENRCFLEAGSPEAFLVTHLGTTTGEKVEILGDKNSLIHVTGSISSQHQNVGGEIVIHGEVLELQAATLNTSGPQAGGTILVGGNRHGENASANYLKCDATTTLYADATECGNGGEVIIWSNKGTVFDGKVFARGGPQGGNGGFVETSSGDKFGSTTCQVNTSAPKGMYGKWELDPFTIQFVNNGSTMPTLAELADSTSSSEYFNVNPSVVNNAMSDVELNAVKPTSSAPASATTINLGNTSTPADINITAPSVNLTLNTGRDPGPGGAQGTFLSHGSIKTTGNLVINANTTLLGPTSLTSTSGSIDFNGRVASDLPANQWALDLDAAGTVKFQDNFGGNLVGDLSIKNATQISFLGPNTALGSKISAEGPIEFNSLITLRGHTDISTTSGNIDFKQGVNVDNPANFWNLGLETPGNITFMKNVGAPYLGARLGNFTIRNANNVKFQANPNAAEGFYAVNVTSFTQVKGTGDIDFQGPLYTNGVPLISDPSVPHNGGDVSIKTEGKINFYYLVNESGTVTPHLEIPSGKRPFIKSVITTSGGRVLNSQPGNGFSAGNVTLEGKSINLLGIYAGGTTAFPGSTGKGGKGGNVSITTTQGTLLQGPIFATGGSGVGGGGQVLPTLIFPNQNSNQAGLDSPGNISISGPLTLGFNGIVLRGGHISVQNVTGKVKNLLAFDAATYGLVETGALSNLSYVIVNNAKTVTFKNAVTADGVVLFNCGDGGIQFKDQVTSTSALAIKNRFNITFDQPLITQEKQLLNCSTSIPAAQLTQPSATSQEAFEGSFAPQPLPATQFMEQIAVPYLPSISSKQEVTKTKIHQEEESNPM